MFLHQSAVLEIAELVNKEVSLLSLKNFILKSLINSSLSIIILKGMSLALGLKAKFPTREVVPSEIPKLDACDKLDVFCTNSNWSPYRVPQQSKKIDKLMKYQFQYCHL